MIVSNEASNPDPFVVLALIFPTVALLLANGFYLLPAYRLSPALFWSLDLAQFVMVPLLSVWGLSRIGAVPSAYGFRAILQREKRIDDIVTFVIVVAAFYYFYRFGQVVSQILIPHISWWPWYESVYGLAMPKHGFASLAVLAYLAVTAGLVEETFFRALPALALRQVLAPSTFRIAYPLLTAPVFALIHWENGPYEVGATFVLGLVVAWLYMRIGNIWPFVLGHAITDIVEFGK